MTDKFCNRCKKIKSLSEFSNYKAKSGKLFPRPWCKSCFVNYQKERLKDPTKKSAQREYNVKAWASMTQEQRDNWNSRRRVYSATRQESENAKARKKRAENPLIGQKQAAKKMKRFHSDPDFRIKENLRSRLYMAIVNEQKAGSAVRDLGCSIPYFRDHLESKFQLEMTWENYGFGKDKWNIDHIIPLSAFDLTNRQHVILACNYLNLQPLWSSDNFSKSDTYPEEYLASLAGGK